MKPILKVLLAIPFLYSNLMAAPLLSETPALTLEGAKFIAAAAANKADSEGWKVVIVISDAGGNVKYLERMDGVQLGSLEIAQQKAQTAVFYRRPTKAFYDRIQSGEIPLTTLPNLQPFAGGLPIQINGQIIGAIGVSGVRGEQDAEIAKAGIDAFLKQLSEQ